MAKNSNHGSLIKKQIDKRIHQRNYMEKEYRIPRLSSFNESAIIHKLNNYFKFLVVRHPFDRLVSADTDTLLNNNPPFQKTYGKRILRLYRNNSDEMSDGKGVLFHEFVKYVTEYLPPDVHFLDIQHQCFPCYIKYDYVAKLETQSSDALYIIN